MNAINLTVTVRRANDHQCEVLVSRTGNGDDLVEQRADQLEEAIQNRTRELIDECGGQFTGGQS